MRKKIISIILAALMLLSMTTVFAETKTSRAILLCYDDAGKLVYSTLMKIGEYVSIPSEYESAAKKVYDIGSEKFMTIEEYDAISGATETAAPEATASPEATAAPTATPKATAAPKPSSTTDTNSPYEKAAYGINAPALVTEVAMSVNSNNEDVYAVTVLYHGEEMTIPVNADLKISTAPAAYADVAGQTAGSLEAGDVVCMTANLAGDKIKRVDLLFRPTAEDIATGDTDYGTNFERLFTTGGTVAGQWAYQKYGSSISRDKYSYAFGIVAEKNGGTITLINKSENPDDALYIDVNDNAYVYACDVSGKEYSFEIGNKGDIQTLPSKVMNGDTVVLSEDYVYNYALVRMVEGEATDIVVFNNYND